MVRGVYVLGGMGPQASLELYSTVIKGANELYKAHNNDDYPEIVIHSIPVPDFISSQSKQQAALDMLIKRVDSIDKDIFGTFAIACNTVHLLAAELKANTSLKFVSMIDEVTKSVKRSHARKVGLLASPTTVDSGLYQAAFSRIGVEVIYPGSEDMEKVESIIRSVIANTDLGREREDIRGVANRLLLKGAELIVLGCTELPIAYGRIDNEYVVSSIDALSKGLLKEYYRQ